jgi:malonyl CoA-acyl carrier protein transacylase
LSRWDSLDGQSINQKEKKMAITKEATVDKVEIVGDLKHIQVRTVTVIKEDGVELSRSFHRHSLAPVTSSYTPAVAEVKDEDGKVTTAAEAAFWTHSDTDISKESTEVQGIANVVWTDAVKKAYKAHMESTVS